MEQLVNDYIRRVKRWPENIYYIDYPIHKNNLGHYFISVVHKDDVEHPDCPDAGKSIVLDLDLLNKRIVEDDSGQ
jgi:hypothetical protein